MKNIKENTLLELGFEKVEVTPEESGDPKGYYYFCYELGNGECLLSQANDEAIDGLYFVEFLTIPDIGRFWNSKDVKELIEIIKRATNE